MKYKHLIYIIALIGILSCSEDEPVDKCYTCFGFGSAAGQRIPYCGAIPDRFESDLENVGGNWDCREDM